MGISTLRCELNTEDICSMPVLAHIGKMKYLWRVYIDDILISTRAMPIGPYDEWVELQADFEEPINGSAYRQILVRQVGKFVVWLNPPYSYFRAYYSGLEPGEVFVFDLAQYRESTLACVYEDSPTLSVQNSGSTLKPLNEFELSCILLGSLPQEDDPIYTVPKLPQDPNGQTLILKTKEYLVDIPWRRHLANALLSNVQPCDSPQDVVDIQIGLEIVLVGFQEAIWQFGKTDDRIAVRFISYPYFPIWICGRQIDEAFGDLVDPLLIRPL